MYIQSLFSRGWKHNRNEVASPDFTQNRVEAIPPKVQEQIIQTNQVLPERSIDFTKLTIDKLYINQLISSSNYVAGLSGWVIKGNGDVEFNNGVFRGSLIAGQIHIPDVDTTAASFHVDTNGYLWMGATQTNKLKAPVQISPAGEMSIGDPTNVYIQISGSGVKIQSSDYLSDVKGFLVSPNLFESENVKVRGIMKGATFQYDVVSAVSGQVIISNSDVLSDDMTALDASTMKISGSSTFAVNDILIIRAITNSGIQEEWLRVTNAASAPTYTVARDLAGIYPLNSNPAWVKGTTVVKQGKSDAVATYSGGWLRLLGEGTHAPYYSVYARTGILYNNYQELIRIGNLNGIGGKVADVYGIFIGDINTNYYLIYDNVSGKLIVNGRQFISDPIFGDGSDGNVTIGNGVTVTLSRDMFYDVLVINGTLKPNGFKVFAKTSLRVGSTGIIDLNGGAGGNASGGTGGTAGVAIPAGSLPGSIAGKAGGNSATNGVAGTNATISLTNIAGKAGVSGGLGGFGSLGPNAAGTGGVAGTITSLAVASVRNIVNAISFIDTGSSPLAFFGGDAGSGSSGGGGNGQDGNGAGHATGGTGGGAGGTGANGGFGVFCSPNITIDVGGIIRANGGLGGNGANGSNAIPGGGAAPTQVAGGGGGGGAGIGGQGGILLFIYTLLTNNGTISVSGGLKGTFGTGGLPTGTGGVGQNGSAGNDGNAGQIIYLQLL